jgi:hypothetical protein
VNRRASTPVIRDNSIFVISSYRPGSWSGTHTVRYYRRRYPTGAYTGEVTI